MEPVQILKDTLRHPYAWPGGYAKLLVTSDGGCVCPKCAYDNYAHVLDSTKKTIGDGWNVVGVLLECDTDAEGFCDNCNDTLWEGCEDAAV